MGGNRLKWKLQLFYCQLFIRSLILSDLVALPQPFGGNALEG